MPVDPLLQVMLDQAAAREAFADAIRSAVTQGAQGARKGRQHVG
jgi:hypothetical protein